MVRRLGAQLRDDLRHSHAPLEDVIRESHASRDASNSMPYQALLSFQDIRARTHEWAGLRLEPYTVSITGLSEELACTMVERDDGLSATLAYSLDLFTPASGEAFSDVYAHSLEQLGIAPEQAIQTVELTPIAQRHRLADWNDTLVAYDAEACVHALIDAQAAASRDAVALRAGDTTLTYGELAARSNQLARRLRARGIGRGALIGLCVERSANLVIAQIAVLKAGATYVPLDPAYPVNRLAYMADDAQLALLITESNLAGVLDWPRERSILLDSDAAHIAAELEDRPTPDPRRDARPEDPAYVIYTSGSTGRPKGVKVQHRAVVNFLSSMARSPGMDALVRLVAVTTLSFDIAVLELLLPLSVGAQIVLADLSEITDARALRALIEATGVNMMQATPGTWRALIDAGWQGGSTFKALIGGEGLPADLATQLLNRTGELWNMYGPTETTVWSTCWRVDGVAAGISIGTPIANTQVHILDAQQRLCPIGLPGEIYIAGAGVALGYLHRDELTAERFVPDPLGRAAGDRMYRTGDRGRWRQDGLLEHMGRLDFQVKVRGHRIELGEIESNLSTHPQVARTVVIVREDRPADMRLVAYVVARDHMPSGAELRAHLRETQPEYSLPQHFVQLDAIPFLPNGKIDRGALPPPADAPDAVCEPPRTDVERAMAEIWQELLGLKRVSVTANFFDLGGHSMLAMHLVARVQQHFARKLPLVALVENGSIRQLCASIERVASSDSLVLLRPGGSRPALFLVHDGLGETLLYRTLALRLNPAHPIYGIQPLSAEGHAMLHTRITDMAAHHAARIRSVQPHGPYLLGGLCAGGVIAFEIARQLQAQGERIGMVALLDAADAASEMHRGRTAAARLRSFVGAFAADEQLPRWQRVVTRLGKATRKIWNLLHYEGSTLLQRPVTRSKLWLLRRSLDKRRTPPAFLRGLSVAQIYQFALSRETVRGRLDGDVALFRATRGSGAPDDEPHAEMFRDPLFGWGRHVQGVVRTFDIPGGHTSMLQDPNVDILAAHVQAWIDGALDQAGVIAAAAPQLDVPMSTGTRL
jgi:amino acid adenylation domain-containing protein